MSEVTVRRVVTRRQRKQFLQFPWTLYRNDPNWIPPLRGNQKELVGYRPHPFYERNCCQTFLAFRGREVCGRIAAILNHGHNQYHRERRGFFGFFECVDDQQAANALFDAVAGWLADQDIHRLRGPVNPSQTYELGLLIDGFDSPPTFMMTYNPSYYVRLIEGYGFRKTQDLYAYWGRREMLPKIQAKLKPVAEQIIEHYGVCLRPLDTSHFLRDVEAFLSIYNRSLVNSWGFVPMSKAEVSHIARGLRHLIVPQLAVGAEIDGKMIGACFGMPDYNPRIRQIDGRLFPFGFLRLLRNKKAIKKIRLISTNVIPEYQRLGMGLCLMHGLVPMALKWDLEEAEFSWVMESNALSKGSLEKGGAKRIKTYRLYDLDYEQPREDALSESGTADKTEPQERTAITAPGRRPLVVRATPPPKGTLEVHGVRTRADLERFIRLPWQIYAEDPQWVPPLLTDIKEFLNSKKHPFYKHGDATLFLATRGGTPVGRILASDDPRYNEQNNANVGCFGMFECFDDEESAGALLDAAADWLRRRGRSAIMGPIDYSTNYPCGLLVNGFDTPPRVIMNHHRPYYAGLLQSWGLTKIKDLYAWWFDDPHDMLTKWRRRAERLAKRGGVTVRPFRKKEFATEVQHLQELYNQSMCKHWGFVKLTDAEFHYLAKRLSQIAVPQLILLAEIDGNPVGGSITLPDLNEAIRPLNGRLTTCGFPIGLVRLARRMRRVKTARMVVLNVLEEYRRRGIAELLILETLDFGKNVLGYTGAELGWTDENNYLVNRTIEAVGGRRHKTYRIYEKPIGR